MHREVGEYAREKGVDVLLALGDATKEAVASFGREAVYFERTEALISSVMPMLCEGTTVLVKGSRFMAMERIVQGILKNISGEGDKNAT